MLLITAISTDKIYDGVGYMIQLKHQQEPHCVLAKMLFSTRNNIRNDTNEIWFASNII